MIMKKIGETDAICPYCKCKLSKFPKAKTKCKQCGNYIYKRTRPSDRREILIKESEIELVEEEWEKLFNNKESFIKKFFKPKIKYKLSINSFDLGKEPFLHKLFGNKYERDERRLFNIFGRQLFEKRGICPYCKKKIKDKNLLKCPHCQEKFSKCFYKRDIFGNHFVYTTPENIVKIIDLKLFINKVYVNVFDFNIKDFFNCYHKLKIIRGTPYISLTDIAWYKIQQDELNIFIKRKELSVFQQLSILSDIYKNRAIVQKYENKKEEAFVFFLQSLHFMICSALEEHSSNIYIYSEILDHIRQNNLTPNQIKDLYLIDEDLILASKGIYALHTMQETFPIAFRKIQEKL